MSYSILIQTFVRDMTAMHRFFIPELVSHLKSRQPILQSHEHAKIKLFFFPQHSRSLILLIFCFLFPSHQFERELSSWDICFISEKPLSNSEFIIHQSEFGNRTSQYDYQEITEEWLCKSWSSNWLIMTLRQSTVIHMLCVFEGKKIWSNYVNQLPVKTSQMQSFVWLGAVLSNASKLWSISALQCTEVVPLQMCCIVYRDCDFIPSSQVLFLALSSRKLKQPSKLTYMFKVIV